MFKKSNEFSIEIGLNIKSLLYIPYSTAHLLTQVSNILEELNLNKVRYSSIGSTKETRGISGGELKRLSVAQELLVDPSLIILDEPTSGFQKVGVRLILKQ